MSNNRYEHKLIVEAKKAFYSLNLSGQEYADAEEALSRFVLGTKGRKKQQARLAVVLSTTYFEDPCWGLQVLMPSTILCYANYMQAGMLLERGETVVIQPDESDAELYVETRRRPA